MQILDSLIEGPLRLRDKRSRNELLGMIVCYLATGEEPEPRNEVHDAIITSVWPVMEQSRCRIVAGRAGGAKPKANGQAPDQANGQANRQANDQASGEANAEANSQANAEANSKAKPKANGQAPDQANGQAKRKRNEEEELGGGKQGEGKARARFTAPTEGEAMAYAVEYAASKGLDPSGFHADRFCAYYASVGWKVGSRPMKDWKATVRGWVLKDCKPVAEEVSANAYDRL